MIIHMITHMINMHDKTYDKHYDNVEDHASDNTYDTHIWWTHMIQSWWIINEFKYMITCMNKHD